MLFFKQTTIQFLRQHLFPNTSLLTNKYTFRKYICIYFFDLCYFLVINWLSEATINWLIYVSSKLPGIIFEMIKTISYKIFVAFEICVTIIETVIKEYSMPSVPLRRKFRSHKLIILHRDNIRKVHQIVIFNNLEWPKLTLLGDKIHKDTQDRTPNFKLYLHQIFLNKCRKYNQKYVIAINHLSHQKPFTLSSGVAKAS